MVCMVTLHGHTITQGKVSFWQDYLYYWDFNFHLKNRKGEIFRNDNQYMTKFSYYILDVSHACIGKLNEIEKRMPSKSFETVLCYKLFSLSYILRHLPDTFRIHICKSKRFYQNEQEGRQHYLNLNKLWNAQYFLDHLDGCHVRCI